MKISDTDFADLKNAVLAVPEANSVTQARYAAHGLSNMRYRWDILHASKFPICERLYPYLNDNHIDSALRKIFGHTS